MPALPALECSPSLFLHSSKSKSFFSPASYPIVGTKLMRPGHLEVDGCCGGITWDILIRPSIPAVRNSRFRPTTRKTREPFPTKLSALAAPSRLLSQASATVRKRGSFVFVFFSFLSLELPQPVTWLIRQSLNSCRQTPSSPWVSEASPFWNRRTWAMESIDGLAHLQTSIGEAYKAAVQTLFLREWWPLVLWTSVSACAYCSTLASSVPSVDSESP